MDATSNLTSYWNNMVPATFFLRCSFFPDDLPLPKKLPLKLLPVRRTPEGAKGCRTVFFLYHYYCVFLPTPFSRSGARGQWCIENLDRLEEAIESCREATAEAI